MASCFKNPNKKLSAKDLYIKKKKYNFLRYKGKMLDKYSRGDLTGGAVMMLV